MKRGAILLAGAIVVVMGCALGAASAQPTRIDLTADASSGSWCSTTPAGAVIESVLHRSILEIGAPREDTAPDWTVIIRSRTNAGDEYDPAFDLVLTAKNAKAGQRFIGPTVGLLPPTALPEDQKRFHLAGKLCIDFDADRPPPPIYEIARVRPPAPVQGLSVYGESPGEPPNFIPMAEHLAACGEDACEIGGLWTPAAAALSSSARRARLAAASRTVVFLSALRYLKRADGAYTFCGSESADIECASRCTGFLVAPGLVATNAHCVHGKTETTKTPYISYLSGWLRPLDADLYERHRPPDFQRLTPLFVGAPNSYNDYAILKIDEAELPGAPQFVETALHAGGVALPKDAPLLVLGYPNYFFERAGMQTEADERTRELMKDALVASHDVHCRLTNAPSADPAVAKQNLLHRCDTTPGSSGSPVYDRDFESVRAVHYGGFVYKEHAAESVCNPSTWKSNCHNSAVWMDVVKADIENKIKDLIAAECAAQSAARPDGAPLDEVLPLDRAPPMTPPSAATLVAGFQSLFAAQNWTTGDDLLSQCD
jgi:hypothetical protein